MFFREWRALPLWRGFELQSLQDAPLGQPLPKDVFPAAVLIETAGPLVRRLYSPYPANLASCIP
jgi:hypothetical protein